MNDSLTEGQHWRLSKCQALCYLPCINAFSSHNISQMRKQILESNLSQKMTQIIKPRPDPSPSVILYTRKTLKYKTSHLKLKTYKSRMGKKYTLLVTVVSYTLLSNEDIRWAITSLSRLRFLHVQSTNIMWTQSIER